MGIKDGWKTTEFWFTLASTLVTIAVALGALPAEEGEQLSDGLSALITGVFMIAPIVAYIWSRATVKKASINAIGAVQSAQIEAGK